jgi:hypothetical protein
MTNASQQRPTVRCFQIPPPNVAASAKKINAAVISHSCRKGQQMKNCKNFHHFEAISRNVNLANYLYSFQSLFLLFYHTSF